MASAFFSELLNTIADSGRGLLRLGEKPADPSARAADLVSLCEQLLTGRGEASGAALAREMLDRYETLDDDSRLQFFSSLVERFGPDPEKLASAAYAWMNNPSQETAANLHFQSEARRQELIRRLNRAPGGTKALVSMRADLLRAMRDNADLRPLDRDFVHLLSSWFNRGFLELRRIDWSSPAIVLEKIIRYEAVHEIHDWDDLRRRIDPVDRRCYAFFHPALQDEPLIFVEVALTAEIPGSVQSLLAAEREPVDLQHARTAVFYSISNCQRGLANVSFGNFLIKQVVEELRREATNLNSYVTLSPSPGFMNWLRRHALDQLPDTERKELEFLDQPDWFLDEARVVSLKPLLESLAAVYYLDTRNRDGRARDPVARFHLGNGARLERINMLGDKSEKGMAEAAGLMVNYLYDLAEIERNHELYFDRGEIAAAAAVRKLVRPAHRGLEKAIASAALAKATSEDASGQDGEETSDRSSDEDRSSNDVPGQDGPSETQAAANPSSDNIPGADTVSGEPGEDDAPASKVPSDRPAA